MMHPQNHSPTYALGYLNFATFHDDADFGFGFLMKFWSRKRKIWKWVFSKVMNRLNDQCVKCSCMTSLWRHVWCDTCFYSSAFDISISPNDFQPMHSLFAHVWSVLQVLLISVTFYPEIHKMRSFKMAITSKLCNILQHFSILIDLSRPDNSEKGQVDMFIFIGCRVTDFG